MRTPRRQAYTLVEVVLVLGILVAISAMVVPNFVREIRRDELPRSARRLRSLLTLTRAHAAFDAKRYRIRFPNEDELDPQGTDRQPLVEREDDPVEEPDVFNLVTESWALGEIFFGDVWCIETRMERPTIELLQDRRLMAAERVKAELEEAFDEEDFEPERLPLFIEPDGTSEWATFTLTTAPRDIQIEELEEHPRLDLIVEGLTGLAWMQRPFYDEELDLFEEKGWPAVLRQDFLDTRVLTEDDVLEIREAHVQGHEIELQGRELQEQQVEQ